MDDATTRRQALKLVASAGTVAIVGTTANPVAADEKPKAEIKRGWLRRHAKSKKAQFEYVKSLDTDQPALLKADFFSETGDDNKDHDTGVWVTVKTEDETILLAHVDNADNSGSDATEYNDGSKHTINLTVDSPGAPRDKCLNFKVHLKQ